VLGVSSAATRVQSVRAIGLLVLFLSSIHSSAALAPVPAQATSLMTTLSGASVGDGVGVGVEVDVGVGVGDEVGVDVDVGVGVDVGDEVNVGVDVDVGVGVDVGDKVGMGIGAEAELAALGVPLTGLPSASNPLRVSPSLVPQLASVSAAV
jgi:hypothetical protein